MLRKGGIEYETERREEVTATESRRESRGWRESTLMHHLLFLTCANVLATMKQVNTLLFDLLWQHQGCSPIPWAYTGRGLRRT